MPSEWLVIPPAEGREAPAYLDAEGFGRWSGTRLTFDAPQFQSEPWHPNPMWVVRVYGAASARDAFVQAYGDVHRRPPGQFRKYLNAGHDRSHDMAGWNQRFRADRADELISDGGYGVAEFGANGYGLL
jgi:hypothetical protein